RGGQLFIRLGGQLFYRATSVITPETLITNMNANSNGCSIGKGMQALRKLNYDAIKQQNMPEHDTPEYKFRQAEVLVPKVVLKDIMNIDFPEILHPL
ncbi:MAG: DarT ssDNA thymidine ADP-ribosyltransferase family protein, partial [Succinivibrio sp.]